METYALENYTSDKRSFDRVNTLLQKQLNIKDRRKMKHNRNQMLCPNENIFLFSFYGNVEILAWQPDVEENLLKTTKKKTGSFCASEYLISD